MMIPTLLYIAWACSIGYAAQPLDRSLTAPINLTVKAPKNDGGTRLNISWEMPKKWSFYILDGDKEIGTAKSNVREFEFTGEVEKNTHTDEAAFNDAQIKATDELGQRLRVLWVDPEKLPNVVNT